MQKRFRDPTFWLLASPLLVGLLYAFLPGNDSVHLATFQAIKGSMSIDVVEGGAIEATQAQVIKSRVEGREGTTILKIIDEGYQVTEKDVAEGLVLVELDSSAIVERIKAQETDVQAALANWMEYVKMREIRESANLSSIKDASVKAKFALMYFKKYLGEEAAQSILDDICLSEETIDDDAGNAINASKSLLLQV